MIGHVIATELQIHTVLHWPLRHYATARYSQLLATYWFAQLADITPCHTYYATLIADIAIIIFFHSWYANNIVICYAFFHIRILPLSSYCRHYYYYWYIIFIISQLLRYTQDFIIGYHYYAGHYVDRPLQPAAVDIDITTLRHWFSLRSHIIITTDWLAFRFTITYWLLLMMIRHISHWYAVLPLPLLRHCHVIDIIIIDFSLILLSFDAFDTLMVIIADSFHYAAFIIIFAAISHTLKAIIFAAIDITTLLRWCQITPFHVRAIAMVTAIIIVLLLLFAYWFSLSILHFADTHYAPSLRYAMLSLGWYLRHWYFDISQLVTPLRWWLSSSAATLSLPYYARLSDCHYAWY